MFDHEDFELLSFEKVPLGQELYLIDENRMSAHEREWVKHFNGEKVELYEDPVSRVIAHSVGNDWLELSWYPNTMDRFHEIPVFLPKSAFVLCVDLWPHDKRSRIFVRSKWIMELHERPLVAFAIIDSADIKKALQAEQLSTASLKKLRDRIDEIANRNPDFAFISFADSVLVKQVWSMGHIESNIKYTYSPEALVLVAAELQRAFEDELNLPAYAVMTQGTNAYMEDLVLHHSPLLNHVSLNALGLPFAQLTAIDTAARSAIREKLHERAELYLDGTFFRSLKLNSEYRRSLPKYHYRSPMTKLFQAEYVATSFKEVKSNLNRERLEDML